MQAKRRRKGEVERGKKKKRKEKTTCGFRLIFIKIVLCGFGKISCCPEIKRKEEEKQNKENGK